jgi:hypothetical protein
MEPVDRHSKERALISEQRDEWIFILRGIGAFVIVYIHIDVFVDVLTGCIHIITEDLLVNLGNNYVFPKVS